MVCTYLSVEYLHTIASRILHNTNSHIFNHNSSCYVRNEPARYVTIWNIHRMNVNTCSGVNPFRGALCFKFLWAKHHHIPIPATVILLPVKFFVCTEYFLSFFIICLVKIKGETTQWWLHTYGKSPLHQRDQFQPAVLTVIN